MRARIQPAAVNRPSRSTYRGHGVMPYLSKLVALAVLVVAAKLTGDFVQQRLDVGLLSRHGHVLQGAVVVSLIVYTLLIAVPFVPGIEIGLALLALGGPKLALPVFLCTLLGLLLSYWIGRLLPPGWLASLLRSLQLAGAARKFEDMECSAAGTGMLPRASLPSRLIPIMLKHRYLALAVALNMPGNALVGGGGGIALVAGMCRLYSWRTFLLTTTLAISPVPLIFMICGADFIG